MRIAFYCPRSNHLKTELAQGGDPVFLHALFAKLRHRGHEIDVISHLSVRRVWKGRVSPRRLLAEALAVRRRVKAFRPDAWLVYKPSRTHPDVFGWWQRPSRYVLLAAQTWQSDRIPRRWRWFLAWIHRHSLRRADFVTVERPPTCERLLGHGVEGKRLRLFPQAVPMCTQIPSQEDARRRLGFPLDTPIALCATRFTGAEDKERKTEMILDLLSVVPSLPRDVLIVLAGDGEGRPRIEMEVDKLGLRDRVRLVGPVENADLKWFYAACDVYAYPHPADRPWTSLLEAQACGRPVVTMRTGSGELTVAAGSSGLLAGTLKEFGDHLAALAGDRSRCAEMGGAARRYFAEFHSIDVRTTQIEELLSGSPNA